MDGAPAADPPPDVDQQRVCFLFQKVILRRMDDVFGSFGYPSVHTEKRGKGRGEYEDHPLPCQTCKILAGFAL